MTMITETYGNGKYIVNISVHDTNGAGLAVFVRGGDKPHLGGVALASPGIEMHGRTLSKCDLWTITVPGHKDAELAQRIAKKICIASGEPVSVSLGIHVENATPEEIELICTNVDEGVDVFLQKYL
ncbi:MULTISPECIES: hypothetical protein [Clostridia]|jgi:hypothetical protein|uniref:Prenylated flavin chaperone LpdD-like domain-containing protein n=1 Tax=Lacrimispora xylanolytica TaxID=29375 RepID=A0ABY7A637_9FIRM|nr:MULTISPECIES: hypothetical protein [Clostridia]MBS5957850.1 hypothetical protein [Clostridiales bacterium]WAJ22134.1 hypothetical protein OW255_11115 [Lacrimispora xylanolytica]